MKKADNLPRVKLTNLSEQEQTAVRIARAVRENAYAPYSNYKVGVAVISVGGRIYSGVNVENVHYKVPHAEENALAEMAKWGERQWKVLVCAAKYNGVPCMSCRQVMREFSGEDLDKPVVIGVAVDDAETVIRCTFAEAIETDSFGPKSLGIDPQKY
jgi:cytidine deaminase